MWGRHEDGARGRFQRLVETDAFDGMPRGRRDEEFVDRPTVRGLVKTVAGIDQGGSRNHSSHGVPDDDHLIPVIERSILGGVVTGPPELASEFSGIVGPGNSSRVAEEKNLIFLAKPLLPDEVIIESLVSAGTRVETMNKDHGDFFLGVGRCKKESGMVGETGGKKDLKEVDVIEITHLPVEGSGGGPIDGDGDFPLSDRKLGNRASVEKSPSGNLAREVEQGGEIERNTGRWGKFKAALQSCHRRFPTHNREADASVGVSFADPFERNLRGWDEGVEIFEFQTGAESSAAIDLSSHRGGLAGPIDSTTAELVEKAGGGKIILGAGAGRRALLHDFPGGAGLGDQSGSRNTGIARHPPA